MAILGKEDVIVPLELHPAEGGDQQKTYFCPGKGRREPGWHRSRLSCTQVGPSFPVGPLTARTRMRCSLVSCRTAALPWHRCIIPSHQERGGLHAAERPRDRRGTSQEEQHRRFPSPRELQG